MTVVGSYVLPEVLAVGLKVVICGSAAGTKSALVGAYYAGPGNQFWGMLCRVGLTPNVLRPDEFRQVLTYGIGLTDIVKEAFGADRDLRSSDFDREDLCTRIMAIQPNNLVFNGKRAARAFFGIRSDYGYQVGRDLGRTRVYVAPSTSGAARKFWNEQIWREIALAVT